jgi:uncharacterized phage-associated protein
MSIDDDDDDPITLCLYREACEDWFVVWNEVDSLPFGVSVHILEQAKWPEMEDAPRFLFAACVYRQDDKFNLAAKYFIAAAKASIKGLGCTTKELFSRSDMEDAEQVCRKMHKVGIIDLLQGGETSAVEHLKTCFQQGRQKLLDEVAAIQASRAIPIDSSSPATTSSGVGQVLGQHHVISPPTTSPSPSHVSEEDFQNRRVIDAGVYLRTMLFNKFGIRKGDLVKVQKLLFYVDALSISEHSRALFQPPSAMVDGPVYLNAHTFLSTHHDVSTPPHGTLDDGTKFLLDRVFKALGGDSASDLSKLSHEEAPWSQAWGLGRDGRKIAPISSELMLAWFSHPVGKEAVLNRVPNITG